MNINHELKLRVSLGVKELNNFLNISEKIIVKESIKLIRNKKEENSNSFNENNFKLHFINNIRISILSLTISFIEFELKNICDAIYETNNTFFSISDLKGNSDFEKTSTFLNKTKNYKISEHIHWNFLDTSRILRNKFLHNQGVLYNEDKELIRIKNFIENQNGISIRNEWGVNFIEIETKEFCRNLINFSEVFLLDIIDNV